MSNNWWIHVEDKLPEEAMMVLVYIVAQNDLWCSRYTDMVMYDRDYGWFKKANVRYWMPIPERPDMYSYTTDFHLWLEKYFKRVNKLFEYRWLRNDEYYTEDQLIAKYTKATLDSPFIKN